VPRQERRLASAAILTILALGFFSTSGTMFAVTGTTAGGASELGWSASVYVDIRAFQQYGNWQIQGETPQSVLTTIQNIRASTGASMSLIGFVKDIQVATESVGGGYTMDSYLNSVRSAAGGQIIPSLNLDIYTQDQGAGSPTSYCNPRDRTDCGPHFFYETSLSFLSLGAISSDPQRTVFLDSWDTFARNSTAYVRANAIFQNLTNEGWKHILVKQIGPGYFAPPSSAAGQGANVVNQTKSPYMVPETSMISQMPNNQVHLLYFDRQNKENPNDETSLQVFLQQLSPAQQVVALDNLAAQQADDGYIFAYPVMTYTVFLGTTYNWDANTAVQPNGQSFLKLIESLISLYDGVQTTSTTSTSSTTSQSSSTTSQSSSTSSSTTSSTSYLLDDIAVKLDEFFYNLLHELLVFFQHFAVIVHKPAFVFVEVDFLSHLGGLHDHRRANLLSCDRRELRIGHGGDISSRFHCQCDCVRGLPEGQRDGIQGRLVGH